ncbi:TRAP transporter small permease [Roseibium sp. SCP14]|uniref:TRAP transporter small permease n=1 Tax=Roseibium sp. SCP14 TaxID=3141375 RepID=UPI00333762DC
MRTILTRLFQTTETIGQLVLGFMVVTICYDAMMRYVFMAPTSWSLEVNTFLIVYVAVMTAANVQRDDGHIRITFFADMAGPGTQRLLRIFTALAGIGFSSIMAWRGWLIAYQAWEYGERVSSSFGTPMVVPYALLPLGFGTLAIQFLIDLFDALFWPDRHGPHSSTMQEI